MTNPQIDIRETIPLDQPQEVEPTQQESTSPGKKILLFIIAIVLIGLIVAGLVLLLQPGTDTARIRDIFIIFMALEFLLIGIAIIILIIQLARLTLLLQNEISPIIQSTHETAKTLRGTTVFLSEHLVEPVLKMNQYLAGLNRVVKFFKPDNE
jgi:hypothetical protein